MTSTLPHRPQLSGAQAARPLVERTVLDEQARVALHTSSNALALLIAFATAWEHPGAG